MINDLLICLRRYGWLIFFSGHRLVATYTSLFFSVRPSTTCCFCLTLTGKFTLLFACVYKWRTFQCNIISSNITITVSLNIIMQWMPEINSRSSCCIFQAHSNSYKSHSKLWLLAIQVKQLWIIARLQAIRMTTRTVSFWIRMLSLNQCAIHFARDLFEYSVVYSPQPVLEFEEVIHPYGCRQYRK